MSGNKIEYCKTCSKEQSKGLDKKIFLWMLFVIWLLWKAKLSSVFVANLFLWEILLWADTLSNKSCGFVRFGVMWQLRCLKPKVYCHARDNVLLFSLTLHAGHYALLLLQKYCCEALPLKLHGCAHMPLHGEM